jgi:hypothetical protein
LPILEASNLREESLKASCLQGENKSLFLIRNRLHSISNIVAFVTAKEKL